MKLSTCLKHDSATLCLCSRGRSMAGQATEVLAWQDRFSLELEWTWWARSIQHRRKSDEERAAPTAIISPGSRISGILFFFIFYFLYQARVTLAHCLKSTDSPLPEIEWSIVQKLLVPPILSVVFWPPSIFFFFPFPPFLFLPFTLSALCSRAKLQVYKVKLNIFNLWSMNIVNWALRSPRGRWYLCMGCGWELTFLIIGANTF